MPSIFKSLRYLFLDMWWLWVGIVLVGSVVGAVTYIFVRVFLGIK